MFPTIFIQNKLEPLYFLIFFVVLSLGMALWIYKSNKNEPINRFFALIITTVTIWTVSNYISSITVDVYFSTFFKRINLGFVCLFFIFAYFFSIFFPRSLKKRNYLRDKFVVLIWILLFFITVLSNIIIQEKNDGWGYGLGSPFLYAFIFFFTIFILFNLFKKYPSLSIQEKLKVQYFLLGASIFAIANIIFNVFFPLIQKERTYWFIGDYSVIGLLGFTAYAIVKQNLFGIRVVLTQVLVVVIAILLFVNFLVSQSNFEYIWKGALFVAFVVFGWLLIKSVMREIKQKEQINQYAKDLASANVELQNAYGKLQTLDKAKSEFISIASHQLRTPLTAIKGYISMLIEGDYGKISKEAVRSMKNVYLANERLVKLVNSLLDMSRIEAGRIVLEFAPIKIDDLARDILREMHQEAQNKKLKLRLVKDKTELPKIMADKTKLRDGLLNLVDNAIKYTNKGEVTIKIKQIEQENKMQIIVQDTGEGMNQEEIDKLFRSFSRADSGKKNWAEGSGLGLYIAKKFIEMHHGSIYAESSGKGQGSRFVITLPIAQPKNK